MFIISTSKEICKTVDCTKPGASTTCPKSCAAGGNGDTGEGKELEIHNTIIH